MSFWSTHSPLGRPNCFHAAMNLPSLSNMTTRPLLRAATYGRSWRSSASECGSFNSPSPEPSLANVLMNFPSLSNFTMRELPNFGACPSATKMSPLLATATPVGWSNVSRAALPAPCPALPSVIRTLPSGLNLVTCMPLPSLASASATQTLPSLSVAMAWGNTNRPGPPKFLIVLPSGPSSKMGEFFEPIHPPSSQRSNTHRLFLESTGTASGCDQGRGVVAQLATNL